MKMMQLSRRTFIRSSLLAGGGLMIGFHLPAVAATIEPKPWIEARFTDLRYWNDASAGGHFPGIERPDVLVSELQTFFRHLP